MKNDPKTLLDDCDTLMLDMDGTILDLAFDNYMWLEHVPERYAMLHSIAPSEARRKLTATFRAMQGRLEWYCLDHWSEQLGLDMVALHREQNHRIGYLPGAERFLKMVRERNLRLLLVTNSHRDTLSIKNEVTSVTSYFDQVYLSHNFGVPKETQEFWQGLAAIENFDPARTLFIDDSAPVLKSAHEFGVRMLLELTRPDTRKPVRQNSAFGGLERLELLL